MNALNTGQCWQNARLAGHPTGLVPATTRSTKKNKNIYASMTIEPGQGVTPTGASGALGGAGMSGLLETPPPKLNKNFTKMQHSASRHQDSETFQTYTATHSDFPRV